MSAGLLHSSEFSLLVILSVAALLIKLSASSPKRKPARGVLTPRLAAGRLLCTDLCAMMCEIGRPVGRQERPTYLETSSWERETLGSMLTSQSRPTLPDPF